MNPRKPPAAVWLLTAGLVLLIGAFWLTPAAGPGKGRVVEKDPATAGTAAGHDTSATRAAAFPHNRNSTAAALPSTSSGGRLPRTTAGSPSLSDPAHAPAAVQPDAAHSLAQALQHGDERSPPIAREEKTADAPSAAELADPATYRRYENRRQEKLYRAYDQEAVIALGEMQRDLQRARAEQLPPDLIREGEEKAARLAQTLRALREGELAAETPPAQ